MRWPDKSKVRDAVIAQLTRNMERMSEAAQRTREGATHEEAKPENDKDTRALEQSYLARGQAMRVEDLAEQIQQLRFLDLGVFDEDTPIAVGALVAVEVDDETRILWLSPHAGGTEVAVDDTHVLVVTGGSPLGRALLERGVGDDFKLQIRGRVREHTIVGVR
jgi:transcription elongation GreA/GreB family factor